jgi:hypothetical protein
MPPSEEVPPATVALGAVSEVEAVPSELADVLEELEELKSEISMVKRLPLILRAVKTLRAPWLRPAEVKALGEALETCGRLRHELYEQVEEITETVREIGGSSTEEYRRPALPEPTFEGWNPQDVERHVRMLEDGKTQEIHTGAPTANSAKGANDSHEYQKSEGVGPGVPPLAFPPGLEEDD